MSEESDKRHAIVASMLPADWDQKPFGLAGEIRAFLGSVKDAGTEIDSGSGDGCADLWVTVQGVEYFISVRKSNKQLMREGKTLPGSSQSLTEDMLCATNALTRELMSAASDYARLIQVENFDRGDIAVQGAYERLRKALAAF